MEKETKIALREHVNEMGSVLAVADAELLGKKLTEGKITLQVSPTFYFEKWVSEEELEEALLEAENVNLVGEKCFRVAERKGYVSEKGIIRISGIPHAQIYKLNGK